MELRVGHRTIPLVSVFSHLHFRGAGRQQDLLSVKELRQGLRNGRSALTGHLVDEAMGIICGVLFVGEMTFKGSIKQPGGRKNGFHKF